MQLTGLIKEHVPSRNAQEIALPFSDISSYGYTDMEKKSILEYLHSGKPFASSMHSIQSLQPGDVTVIGSVGYYTDGQWIWPTYLMYYLEHYNIALAEDFLSYLRSISFQYTPPSSDQVKEAIACHKRLLV